MTVEKADCIYPDCQIRGEWSGNACEHSCSFEDEVKMDAIKEAMIRAEDRGDNEEDAAFVRAALQQDIDALQEREVSYRLALAYIANHPGTPGPLKEIATTALDKP